MEYLVNPKSGAPVIKTAEFTCERCGKTFTMPFWFIKKGRKFCSDACRKQNPLTALLEKAKIQENGCWNYTGFIGTGGYGQIMAGGRRTLAHILMWETWNEEKVPEGLVVRHICVGNPRCINPDHLTIGTQKQNIQDCIDQGRFKVLRGSERPNAKLTEAQVLEMRNLRNPQDGSKPHTFQSIADKFNVSYTAAWLAITGNQWRHLK